MGKGKLPRKRDIKKMKKAIFIRIRKDGKKVEEKYLSNVYFTMVDTIIFQWTSKKENALKVAYSKYSMLDRYIELLEEEYHKTYYIFYTKVN